MRTFFTILLVITSYGTVSGQILTRDEQIKHVEWLEYTLKEKYSLYHPKRLTVEANLNDLKLKIKDSVHYQYFYENVRHSITAIEDVHLRVRPNRQLPLIALNIQFCLGGENIYILNSSNPEIPAGSRVLAFDNIPALEYLDSVAGYCFGSTRNGRRALAINRLTDRNFMLPKNLNYQTLTHTDKDGVIKHTNVPFHWLNKEASIKNAEKEFIGLDMASDRPFLKYQNNPDELGLQNPTEYKLNNQLILRTGYRQHKTHKVAVIQLYEFTESALHPSGKNTVEILRSFLLESNHDVIVDLRFNEGGNGNTAMELMSLFSRPSGLAYPTIRSHPVNQETYQLLNQVVPDGGLVAKSQMEILSNWDTYENDFLTPFYYEWELISPDSILKGFDKRVFLFTGPQSISTTDMFINMLKFNNNRVITIGEPSHGSGSGYIGIGDYHWEPEVSNDGLFVYDIPNKIVGKPIKISQGPIDYEVYRKNAKADGNPIPVDKEYVLTNKDLFNRHEDFWLWFFRLKCSY